MKTYPVVLYSDASVVANGQPGLQDASYAVVLSDGTHSGLVLRHVQIGDASVNVAEYCGVLAALQWLHDADLDRPGLVITDSMLVFGHVMLDWQCNSPKLLLYRDSVRWLLEALDARLIWKSRNKNKAGWFFEEILEQRRKAKYRARKVARGAKRKRVRSITLAARAAGTDDLRAVLTGMDASQGAAL